MGALRKQKQALFWEFFLVVGLAFLTGWGCKNKSAQEEMASRMAEKAIQEHTGKEAKVDIQGGNVRIQLGDSSGEIRQTQEWSADIPSEVPRFTLGKIQGVTTGEKDGKKSWNIVVEKVQGGAPNTYLEELKSKGWKITSTVSAGSGSTFSAQKGRLDLVAMFHGEEHSAVITVVQK